MSKRKGPEGPRSRPKPGATPKRPTTAAPQGKAPATPRGAEPRQGEGPVTSHPEQSGSSLVQRLLRSRWTQVALVLGLAGAGVQLARHKEGSTNSAPPHSAPNSAAPVGPVEAGVIMEELKTKRLAMMQSYLEKTPLPLPKISTGPLSPDELTETLNSALMPIEEARRPALETDPQLKAEVDAWILQTFPLPEKYSYPITIKASREASPLFRLGTFLKEKGIDLERQPVVNGPDAKLSDYHYGLVLLRLANRTLIPKGRILLNDGEKGAYVTRFELNGKTQVNVETKELDFPIVDVSKAQVIEGGSARFDSDSGVIIIDKEGCTWDNLKGDLTGKSTRVPWLGQLAIQVEAEGLDQCDAAAIHESEHGLNFVENQQRLNIEARTDLKKILPPEAVTLFTREGETGPPVTTIGYLQLDEMAAHGLTIYTAAQQSRTYGTYELVTLLMSYADSYAYAYANLFLRPLLFPPNTDMRLENSPTAVAHLGQLDLTQEEIAQIGLTMYTVARKAIDEMVRQESEAR